MKKEPLVSIIIPTFNRAKLLYETLVSVEKQTYKNWECIVVDDGSEDNSQDVVQNFIKRDSRFIYLQRPSNLLPGGNDARNFGFENSKGDYINWFDSDDVMLEEFIEEKIEKFTDAVEIVFCGFYRTDENLEVKNQSNFTDSTDLFKEYVLGKQPMVTDSAMFKRNFLTNKKLFNSIILRGQETEFFSRLFFDLKVGQYILLNKGLFLHRTHVERKSSENQTYKKDFKRSEFYVVNQLLGFSIKRNDFELVQIFYKSHINLIFKALEYKDYENVLLLKNGLKKYSKNNNLIFCLLNLGLFLNPVLSPVSLRLDLFLKNIKFRAYAV